jgi:multiple sugar transport system ATP-binding protein
MAQVVLKDLNRKFDEVHAVKDLNLQVHDKEFIVLVGPSGCGKSTTLRMVARLEGINSGEIYIGDQFVNDLPPKDRDIAIVFQNYALYPHMTVYDNMAFGRRRKTNLEADDFSIFAFLKFPSWSKIWTRLLPRSPTKIRP